MQQNDDARSCLDRAATEPLLQVEGLCFAYPQRRLFDQWSASIAAGVTLVSGDESTGKSTLLQLLAGDLAADSGRLRIGQHWLDRHPGPYRSQVFRTDPRSPAPDQLTPQAWFAGQHLRYPAFDDAGLGELMRHLALLEYQHKPMFMLSTGSRRKVWLAAAFASGAAVTLIDQPFAALDKASIGMVLELLADASRNPTRAWMLADYEPPPGIDIVQTIELR